MVNDFENTDNLDDADDFNDIISISEKDFFFFFW